MPPLSAECSVPSSSSRDVAEHEHELVGDLHRVVRIVDEQRTVEAEAHLRGRHHVRVIPEQPGVGHDEVVGERSSRLDRRLAMRPARRPSRWAPARRASGRSSTCGSLLEKCTMSRSPRRARISGPGSPPLYVHASVRTPGAISSDATRASSVISTIFGSGLVSAASGSFSACVPPGGLQALGVGDAAARHQ